MILSNGSRSRRIGMDFSSNLGSNLEIHGEWARIYDTQRPVIDASGKVTVLQQTAVSSFLLGTRYLTERDTTCIFEYYRNGPGYSESELQGFYSYVDTAYAQYLATGNDAPLQRAANVSRSGVARPNPGRDYLYLRVSQKVLEMIGLKNYPLALKELTSLRHPVDKFFEGVMVMAQDEKIRSNRLSLLAKIAGLFFRIGDFSKITTA